MSFLSIILDIVIVILLGFTIFYALKLSRSLNAFRAHRKEFDKLLDELTRSLGGAQQAMHSLKTTGTDAGRNLLDIVNKSRSLADELQILNQSGEKLAARLETLAEKNRRIAQGLEDPADFEEDLDVFAKPARPRAFDPDEGPAFTIHDRDFGATGPEESELEDDMPGHLQSHAEKELYRALMQNRKKSGGGRS